MHDLLIIGGGPAGISAGVYAARKQLKTILIAEEVGGQSTVSEGIENWIGTVRISGADLAKSLREHLDAYKGQWVETVLGERVEKLEKTAAGFTATTTSGQTYSAQTVLIASGASRKRLEAKNADVFEHKGVTYCASCDGPLFSGMDVVVVGGGNAGFETAAQLLAYAKSVTLIHRGKAFKADAITVEKVLAHENMKALLNTVPVEVLGEKFVTGLLVEDRDTKEQQTLPASGIFVEVGVMPNTAFAKDLVKLDEVGRIIVNPRDQKAHVIHEHGESPHGVWAAGDCTDELYHQNNIAAGDGVKALEDIYVYIKTK